MSIPLQIGSDIIDESPLITYNIGENKSERSDTMKEQDIYKQPLDQVTIQDNEPLKVFEGLKAGIL